MALKNLIRTKTSRHGVDTWSLTTLSLEPVEAFDTFCEKNLDFPFTTRKRYAEAVSRFLDYLFEAGAFEPGGMSARRINEVIEAYPQLLRDGSVGLIRRIESRGRLAAEEWLVRTVRALAWERLSPGSFSNTLAPVNRFLQLSETLAREEMERAQLLGLPRVDEPHRLLKVLDGHVEVSPREVARMRQNSLLGSVAKFCPKGIRRPRKLALPGETPQDDRRKKDFPLDRVTAVVRAGRHWRDKALWLLLAASGIRTSEARNLLLQDVDFEQQKVWVIDPHNRRFAMPSALKQDPRFKGRTLAATYLFPPLRQEFFYALGKYLEQEFVPAYRPGEPQYLFQYIEPKRRGEPLVNASDGAMNAMFKKAVAATDVPPPCVDMNWFLHSLRHLYGVYMLNDYPVSPQTGRFGLPLTDVQMLMGHKKSSTTAEYARTKATRLMSKLQASDEAMLGLTEEEQRQLPSGVLERLEYRS